MTSATARTTLPKAAIAIGALLLAIAATAYFLGAVEPFGGQDGGTAEAPTTDGQIAQLRILADERQGDANVRLRLAEAYLQRGRESEEVSYSLMAKDALSAALEITPDDPVLLTAMGRVSLSLHRFEEAKAWGLRAFDAGATSANTHALLADAHLELGEYEAALGQVQSMLDIDPGVNAYTRTAYVRELHGDVPGAIAAHMRAIELTRPDGEPAALVRSTLGDLYLQLGRTADAKRMYTEALQLFPSHLGAREGLAQALLLEGDPVRALAEYETLIEALPDVGHLSGAGGIAAALGDTAGAERYYSRANAFIEQIDDINRFLYTREIVTFYADHGLEPREAVRLAREELALRKDIYGYDSLAWALYNDGAYLEAAAMAAQALRLGTQDPSLHYHAGLVEAAIGNEAVARAHLQRTLDINPLFQAPGVHPHPREALATLGQ